MWAIRVSVLYHLPYFLSPCFPHSFPLFPSQHSPQPFRSDALGALLFLTTNLLAAFHLFQRAICWWWFGCPRHTKHTSPGLLETDWGSNPIWEVRREAKKQTKGWLQLGASRAFIFSIPFCFIPLSAFSLLYSPLHSVGLFLWLTEWGTQIAALKTKTDGTAKLWNSLPWLEGSRLLDYY